MTDQVDLKKRQFLVNATAVCGLAGVVGAAAPFIKSMMPSRKEDALSTVTVDVKQMKPGEQKTVLWQHKPVFIIRRTKEGKS